MQWKTRNKCVFLFAGTKLKSKEMFDDMRFDCKFMTIKLYFLWDRNNLFCPLVLGPGGGYGYGGHASLSTAPTMNTPGQVRLRHYA